MARRFYLPSSGTPDISPAFNTTSWPTVDNADRMNMVTTRINSAMALKVGVGNAATGRQLLRQYISAPLAAQTLSGTAYGVARGVAEAANGAGAPAIRIAKCNANGSVVTEIAAATHAADGDVNIPPAYSTTLTNRRFETPPANTFLIPLTSTVINEGDRLIVETGYSDNTANASRWCSISFGDDSATDLPEDELATSADNSWIEFSADIAFSVALAGPTDFKVQYVSGTLTGSGATLTAPADFQAIGALSKAFILPATTMPTAGFGADDDASVMRSWAVTANMTAVDTIALLRGVNGASNASYAFWIVEYIGADGGANEFIMRGKDVQTFGASATTADTTAISGIASLAKCVPFINGRHSDVNTASLRDFLAEARVYNNGTNNVIGLTRELTTNGEPTYVCYCVEFTGVNWKIQSGLATNFTADTNKDVTITAVEALSKAFVFGYFNPSDAGTPAAATWYAWLSSTTNLRSRTPVAGTGTDFRWFVIENSDARFSVETVNVVDGSADWTAGASPQTQTVAIASTRATATFVRGRAGSSESVTTSNPASNWRFRQASQTSVEAHRTRSLGSSEYVIQAIQLPIDTLPAVLRLPRTNPLVRM